MNSHNRDNAQVLRSVASIFEEARGMLGIDLSTARRRSGRAAVLMGGSYAPFVADIDTDCRAEFGDLAPWQMIKVARYADASLERCVSRARMAAEAYLRPSYFAQAFQRSFRLSPHAHVLERRVEPAKRLTVGTVEPLSEIAAHAGSPMRHMCMESSTNRSGAIGRCGVECGAELTVR